MKWHRAAGIMVGITLLAACGATKDSTPEATSTTSSAPITTTSGTVSAPATTTTVAPDPIPPAPTDPAVEYGRCTPLEDTGAPITFLPQWVEGEVIALERTEIEDRTGRPIELGTSYAPVELVVNEAAAGGFAMTWTLGEAFLDLGTISAADSDLLNQFIEIAKMRFEYEADPTGVYLGVTNTEEIADRLETAMDLLLEIAGGDGAPTGDQAFDMRALMRSEEFIQTTASQDIALYHGLYGLTVDPTTPQMYDTLLPNAFGGEPFPAIETIEVVNAADENGCVVVAMTVKPDPEQFVEIMLASLPDSAEPVTDEDIAEMASIEIRNELEFIYDPGSGRMRRISATQTIAVGDEYRKETVILTEEAP